MLRRRPPGPALSAFLRTAEHIAAAQRALLAAIPTSRRVGEPLPVALASFERHLRAAAESIAGWPERIPAGARNRCIASIDSAAALAKDLHGVGSLPFEPLNARVGDLLHPLEEFAKVERELRSIKEQKA